MHASFISVSIAGGKPVPDAPIAAEPVRYLWSYPAFMMPSQPFMMPSNYLLGGQMGFDQSHSGEGPQMETQYNGSNNNGNHFDSIFSMNLPGSVVSNHPQGGQRGGRETDGKREEGVKGKADGGRREDSREFRDKDHRGAKGRGKERGRYREKDRYDSSRRKRKESSEKEKRKEYDSNKRHEATKEEEKGSTKVLKLLKEINAGQAVEGSEEKDNIENKKIHQTEREGGGKKKKRVSRSGSFSSSRSRSRSKSRTRGKRVSQEKNHSKLKKHEILNKKFDLLFLKKKEDHDNELNEENNNDLSPKSPEGKEESASGRHFF